MRRAGGRGTGNGLEGDRPETGGDDAFGDWDRRGGLLSTEDLALVVGVEFWLDQRLSYCG